ncbi:MAG: hypothetical protein EKK41_00630 [Hyphomicrobiales bacterium]|nr:MAG: hypothetical protein EKK41_00630 [Hyphomicrobiales bacterium]
MPYYFGEDSPGWDEFMDRSEAGDYTRPLERFTYILPWQAKATVLNFPRSPNAPAAPEKGHGSPVAASTARPSILERLFGIRPRDAVGTKPPEVGLKTSLNNFHLRQKREAQQALVRVAHWAAAFRALGVSRVLMRYDGGNDEGFIHFEAFELADGRRLAWKEEGASEVARRAVEAAGRPANDRAFEDYGHLEILVDAAIAFMGPGFGTGPYEMFGAITIDCEACTLTDETDRARAQPDDEGA